MPSDISKTSAQKTGFPNREIPKLDRHLMANATDVWNDVIDEPLDERIDLLG